MEVGKTLVKCKELLLVGLLCLFLGLEHFFQLDSVLLLLEFKQACDLSSLLEPFHLGWEGP